MESNDLDFVEEVCKEVEVVADGSFHITSEAGGTLWVLNQKGLSPPRPGETVRYYTRNKQVLGSPIRGLKCGDKVYYYQTQEEYDAEFKAKAEEAKRKSKEEFEANIQNFTKDIAALPAPFQDRFKFFMSKPDWAAEFGPYELFTCQEAVKIAEHCKTPEAIRDFYNEPFEKQKAVISDDHSGNTFGAACLLAKAYLDDPQLLRRMHGALCPLVGCKEYGCWCTTEEAAGLIKEAEESLD